MVDSLRGAGFRALLLTLTLIAVCTVPVSALPSVRGAWFRSDGPPRAVALVIHGLNLEPSKMDDLCRMLAKAGIEAFRLSLSGHGFGSFRDVTAASWLEQTEEGYRTSAQEARRLGVPLYFVGYSLGGLLGEAFIATSSETPRPRFDRVVLLAPAIALRPVVYLVKGLFIFGKGFALPSADRPSYRAHRATPMAAYEALFRIVSLLRESHFHETNIPTLVVMRRDDELVSLRGIRSVIRTYDLTRWSISVIPGRGVRGYPHHLIIDEPSLGHTDWVWMTSSIIGHLLGSGR